MMSGPSLRDTPHLLAEALDRGQALLRAEVRLVRAELGESLNRVGVGLTWYAGAVLMALVALNALAAAAVLTLGAAGLSPALAALTIAALALIVVAICATLARRKLKAAKDKTRQSARRLRRDAHSLKEVRHV